MGGLALHLRRDHVRRPHPDNFDRRLCGAYLLTYVREELLDGLAFFPKFEAPPPSLSHKQFMEYIDETLVNETPMAFGLHANAEINFMTQQAAALFSAAGELAPRGATGGGGMTLQEKVKRILDDIMEKLPDLFPREELWVQLDPGLSREHLDSHVGAIRELDTQPRVALVVPRPFRALAAALLGLRNPDQQQYQQQW